MNLFGEQEVFGNTLISALKGIDHPGVEKLLKELEDLAVRELPRFIRIDFVDDIHVLSPYQLSK